MPSPTRYDSMKYNRCGKSGLKLPAVSLGLWHNFGGVDALENSRAMILRAFDLGITHFDIANNYGPPPGSAEETLAQVLHRDLPNHRDELVISTKAGYLMWPGPYGEFGSRKYLLSSLDQSLRRLRLDYVDIFYQHRPDPDTPLEESMGALADAVRSGKALYVGLSNYYSPELTKQAAAILRRLGTPCLIHQPVYHMFHRPIEEALLGTLDAEGIGCIVFCPLAQGLLTNRYLEGVPEDSRANKPHGALKRQNITPEQLAKVRKLNDIALARGQSLAQMAVAWTLRRPTVTSSLIGASKVSQIEEIVAGLAKPPLTEKELAAIDAALA